MSRFAYFLVPISCLALFSLLPGCPGEGDDADEPLTVVTFNAGLAVGFVPGAEDRASKASEAVGGLTADVVCLQEVWRSDHVDGMLTATGTAFPHAFMAEPSQEILDEPACGADDLEPLITCVSDNCDLGCLDDMIDCMFASCAFNFLTLEKPCMECVQANVGRDPDDIEQTCTAEHTKYAYDGAFGTGILSAYPLTSTDEHVFASTTNRRSLLHAVVDAPMGPVDVYCTHLTAVFDLIPYPKEEGSWEEEQTAQIADMLAFIDSSATTGRTVLAGDMNAGPDVGDSVADQLANWNAIAASGMAVPYVDAEGPCTFCSDNPLQGTDTDTDDRVLDHVLVDGFGPATAAERVLDQEITTERCGEQVPGAYSDHYGVLVTVPAN